MTSFPNTPPGAAFFNRWPNSNHELFQKESAIQKNFCPENLRVFSTDCLSPRIITIPSATTISSPHPSSQRLAGFGPFFPKSVGPP
jgi:hypothetical protein